MVNSHDLSSFFNETNLIYQHDCLMKKNEAHESECSHIKYFCETSYVNSFVPFPLLLYQCTVDCGISKRLECKVWGVNKIKC